MQKVLAMVALLMTLLIVPAAAQTFDNSGGGTWNYYMSFPITTTPITYAQYKIVINGSTWCIYNSTGSLKVTGTNTNFWTYVNPNGTDIRIFNQNGAQMYFWIESFNATTQQATIWVNLTRGSTELNIAYGNPSASISAYDNGTKTFPFFDDFNSLSKWTVLNGGGTGTATIATYDGKSMLELIPGGVTNRVAVTAPFNTSEGIIEVRAVTNATVSDGFLVGFSDGTMVSASSDFPNNGYIFAFARNLNAYHQLIKVSAGTTTTLTELAGSASSLTYYNVALEWKDGTLTGYIDGKKVLSAADTTFTSLSHVHISADANKWFFDWIFVASTADPASFGTPVVKHFGELLEKGLVTNVTYLSATLPASTLYVNVTYLDTGSVSTYNPTMTYIPYGTTYNASASVDVTGVNATYGANITIMLDANKTLSTVVYNGTVRTANLTALGTKIINGVTYNVWNLTVYENGTLTIYALTAPKVNSYSGITLFKKFNVKSFTCTFLASVDNVNSTYGANITFLLNSNLTLSKFIYNNTDLTANLTYAGTSTVGGEIYNKYYITVYENGTLNITATIPNIAYHTTFILDHEPINLTVPAVIGEDLTVKIPWTGNISVGKFNAYNTTSYSLNTKDLGLGTHIITINIDNKTFWKFGCLLKSLNVTYGRLNVTAKGMNSKPFEGVTIAAYNTNYSLLTMNLHKLWAGWQDIDVYYHGMKLNGIRFYLNHTTNGANITLNVNATRIKDYRGMDREIYSPHSFKVINLSTKFPYSVMKLCNCSGTVIVNYTNNPPTAVKVEGATSYSYNKPVLKITVNGVKNVTITDLYRFKAPIVDALGHKLSGEVNVNGSVIPATDGVATKLLKPENYTVKYPKEINGFKFRNFQMSFDLTPVPWGKDVAGVYWRYEASRYVWKWVDVGGEWYQVLVFIPAKYVSTGWNTNYSYNDSNWNIGETPFADNGYFHRTYLDLNGGTLYARHKFNLLKLMEKKCPAIAELNLSEWKITIKKAMLYVSVDDEAWIWLNGKQVLYAKGHGKADVTKYINLSNNLIAAKAVDSGKGYNKFDLKLTVSVVISRNNTSYTLTFTKDSELIPPAYRVPTKIITHEYRIASANKFPWLPFPIPFLSKNVKTKDLPPTVRFEGFVRDYYNEPVPNRTIEVIVKSPGNTRIYNITTDSSGNFAIDIDLATGINYTITYKFAGDNVFLGSSTTKKISIEGLPLPPPPKSTPSTVLIVAAVGAGIVAIAGGAIYLTRRSKAQMRTRMEDEFKFFKRLK